MSIDTPPSYDSRSQIQKMATALIQEVNEFVAKNESARAKLEVDAMRKRVSLDQIEEKLRKALAEADFVISEKTKLIDYLITGNVTLRSKIDTMNKTLLSQIDHQRNTIRGFQGMTGMTGAEFEEKPPYTMYQWRGNPCSKKIYDILTTQQQENDRLAERNVSLRKAITNAANALMHGMSLFAANFLRDSLSLDK